MSTRRELVLGGATAASLAALSPAAWAAPDPWAEAAAIVRRIRRPRVPRRDFPIARFGARPDGSNCREALRRAIEAAHAAGGGRVVIPPGVWLTGAVVLKSRVELHVAKGATLKFSRDPVDYLPVVLTRHEGTELMNYSPFIYALEQEDIALTGEGVLDGQADAQHWWNWARPGGRGSINASAAYSPGDRKRLDDMAEAGVPVAERVFGAGHTIRPVFIQPYRCRRVLIEGLTIINSPMWEVNPVECSEVVVRGLNISSLGPNNDGCDPESCRDVLIEDCVFATGDDCIAIKSGRNADGRRLQRPTENVVIRGCAMKDGHGGMTLGSEITGGVRNVFVERCRMDSPRLEIALRFKNNAMRGGVLEKIYIRDVSIGQVARAVLAIDYNYQEGPHGPFRPVFDTLVVERVTAGRSGRALDLQGYKTAPIRNVSLRDCDFGQTAAPDIIRFVEGLSLVRVRENGVAVHGPSAG